VQQHLRDVKELSAGAPKLTYIMNDTLSLSSGLDDLLVDLRLARQDNDLGRLVLLAYCEVRRWARKAGEFDIAEQASDLVTGIPHASRADFIAHVDRLIQALELIQPRPAPAVLAPRPAPAWPAHLPA
jgi:hypothetical protein